MSVETHGVVLVFVSTDCYMKLIATGLKPQRSVVEQKT